MKNLINHIQSFEKTEKQKVLPEMKKVKPATSWPLQHVFVTTTATAVTTTATVMSPPSPLSLPSVTTIATVICHHYCHYHHHHHHHPWYSCCTISINVVSTCQQGSSSQHLSPSAAHTHARARAHTHTHTHNPLYCTYVIKQQFQPFVPVLFMYHNVTYHGVRCNGTSGTEQRHLRHTNSKHPATPKISCSRMALFLTTAIWLSNFPHMLLYNCIQGLVLNICPTSALSLTKSP